MILANFRVEDEACGHLLLEVLLLVAEHLRDAAILGALVLEPLAHEHVDVVHGVVCARVHSVSEVLVLSVERRVRGTHARTLGVHLSDERVTFAICIVAALLHARVPVGLPLGHRDVHALLELIRLAHIRAGEVGQLVLIARLDAGECIVAGGAMVARALLLVAVDARAGDSGAALRARADLAVALEMLRGNALLGEAELEAEEVERRRVVDAK